MGLHGLDRLNRASIRCAKPLSMDGKEVHMERKNGSSFDVSIDRFCKEDQKLLSQVYSAEKQQKLLLEEEGCLSQGRKKGTRSRPR